MVLNSPCASGFYATGKWHNSSCIAQFQILEAIQNAKDSGLSINTISMNAALSAFANADNLKKVMELYQDMVTPEGCGADEVTYGIILKVMFCSLRELYTS